MSIKFAKALGVVAVAVALSVCALAGCSETSGTSSSSASPSSASVSVTSSTSSTSNSSFASDFWNGNSSASSDSGNANSSSSMSSGGVFDSESGASKTTDKTATGKVVCTTYEKWAKEVGYSGNEFADDTELLTLLVLDEPITVTAYKGGSDATVEVKTIKLPNDEQFRQFKHKTITIKTDKWGAAPADVAGLLYDLVLDPSDGVAFVENAS